MTARARAAAERAGRRAELLAAAALTLKGFAVLKRRFRAPGGEIDIVAKRGALVVFAEVKARANLDDAVFAVEGRARRRIEAAARAFLSRHPHLAECAQRYDIIAVRGWRWRHHADAWRDGE